MIAVQRGNLQMANLLLDNRADVNAGMESGPTPLIQATRNENPEMVRLLLKHGAEENTFPNNPERDNNAAQPRCQLPNAG